MTNLVDGILNYLEMESTGALMVSGEWGCGKTYHIENVILPALTGKGYNPIKVSLFGIESVNEIPLKIAENYHPQEKSEGEKSSWFNRKKNQAGSLMVKSTELMSSVKWLDSFVDIKALTTKYSNLLYKAIPTEKTVIFLDDIERVVDSIDIHILLGAINGLVEQRGYKVVVIANNSYIDKQGKNKLIFKEKVIEKTLVYDPDVVSIFTEICNRDYRAPFSDFMKDSVVVAVIDPSYPSYKENKDLQMNLRNIRIVKFALSHFHKLYDVCEVVLKDEEDATKEQFLYSLWASIVGLSIEYKRNRLTYEDKEQFVNYVDLSSVDWKLDDCRKDEENMFEEIDDFNKTKKEDEEQRSRVYNRIAHIFQRIVKAHNLPIIVSPQVFDFVTAGISLDKDGLEELWRRYKSQVERSQVKPAYTLLQRFLQQQWAMSNQEMKNALTQLAQYVEAGEFEDNMSYVNAATFLQHLRELTPYTQQEVEDKIKAGIDKMYDKVTELSLLDKLNLDVVESEIPKKSRWVIDYERQKMAVVSDAAMDADIKEVCRQFNEDLPALDKRLSIQYNSKNAPDFMNYPILSHIPEEDVEKKFKDIQPNEVVAIYDILNSRFIQSSMPKRYEEELKFVRSIKSAIEKRSSEKKEYADILIADHLLKVIERILPKR